MRELNQKQLWLLRMLFEEDITTDEIQRYGKDNASSSRGRLKRQVTDKEITGEPAIIQRVDEGGGDEQPLRSRRTKGKSKTN